MAKNLQTVLNSVVNDLLQEVSPDATLTDEELQAQQAALSDVKDAQALAAGIKSGAIPAPLARAALKGGYGGDHSDFYNEYIGRAGGWGNRWSQNQAFADELAKQPVPGVMDQAKSWMSEHPYATAGIGTGLGAALAAGAGALYLRKKQREANRAAGR